MNGPLLREIALEIDERAGDQEIVLIEFSVVLADGSGFVVGQADYLECDRLNLGLALGSRVRDADGSMFGVANLAEMRIMAPIPSWPNTN